MRKSLIVSCVLAGMASQAHAAGALENPAADATVSGIGVISGWYCPATRIEIQVDASPPTAAGYGTDRLDTQAACGRRDTGFGLLLNWAVLAPGPHTIRALADGVEFARRSFTVASYGSEFLRGKAASATIHDFPEAGRTTVVEWQESLQSFVTREVRDGAPLLDGIWNGANLEKRSNCSSPQNDGTRGTYAQWDIGTNGGLFTISEAAVTGLTCTYNGRITQDGTQRHASGTYSCSDGKQGSFDTTGFVVTDTQMQIRMNIQLTGKESCTIDAIVEGARF